MILILIILVQTNYSFGEWKIVTETDSITKKIFSIRNNEKTKFNKGFYFPPFWPSDSILKDGYTLNFKKQQLKNIKINKDVTIWEYKLKNSIQCHLDSTFLYQRFKINNINNYKILLYADDGSCYIKNFSVNYKGYQIPQTNKLNQWNLFNKSNKINTNSSQRDSVIKLIHIHKIAVVIPSKNSVEKREFTIGDFRLYNKIKVKKEFVHPFFEDIKGNSSIDRIKNNSLSEVSGLPLLLASFPYYVWYTGNFGPLQVKISNNNEMDVFYKIVRHSIYKYPFFKERNINEKKIKKRVNKLKSCNDTLIVDSLVSIINSFHDPHFYIKRNKEKKTSLKHKSHKRPIHGVYLNGNYYIGAVFDTTLRKKLNPGMEILFVNGKPIEKVIDSLSKSYNGTPSSRRKKAISQLFYKKKTESTRICVLSDNDKDTINTQIYYKNKCIVPKRFTPKHMAFYNIGSNTSYLKLNSFSLGDYTRFINYYNELKDQKSIIIDLRNNSGGENIAAMRIASCFIQRPKIYNRVSYLFNKNNRLKEPTVIQPNLEKNLSHLQIILLINKSTACSSEEFISFIKSAKKSSFVVGAKTTAGTLATKYSIAFPSGFKFNFNSLAKIITSNGKIIEGKGIEPDIHVYLEQVEDFAPYKDKILKTAIQLTRYK